MTFSIEQTAHPSAVHRHIAFAATRLTPLDVSLANIKDEAMRHSCAGLHAFVLEMLSDMYEQPEAYGMPAGKLETFLRGRKVNRAKRDEPNKTKTIYSHTYNAVESYLTLLLRIGQEGKAADGRLLLSADAYDALLEAAKTTNSPIAAQTRREGLARVGLMHTGDALVSERHPDMFPALTALAATSKKTSGMPAFNFKNLEFRQLAKPYKPTYEDYARVLPVDRRRAADLLDAHARGSRAKPACNTFWKADYKYKGTQVMCLDSFMGELGVRITATYHWDNPALINDRLAKESPALQENIQKNLAYCTGCNPAHKGMLVTVLGRPVRVCGMLGFRWNNPSEEDLAHIQRCIELRCEIIDEIGKRK